MTKFRRVLSGCLSAFLGMWVCVSDATAGPLPVLDKDQREAWQAVGRVNGQGYRMTRGCSGTLIAPDLVVTAAHCVVRAIGIGPKRHYVAGWYRGRFTAHRVSQEVHVHPLYLFLRGQKRLAYDLAVIRLSDPIPEGLVKPIPLLSEKDAAHSEALLLGYQNSVPHALGGKPGCPRLAAPIDDRLFYECEVVGGTSGGAVIVDTPEGPALAAVIVARSGPQGYATAVPVNAWLRQAWYDAMAEARARH